MTTPVGYELLLVPRYARSRLTVKELASGLIQEELRAKEAGRKNEAGGTTDRAIPDFLRGPAPPAPSVTPTERVSKALKWLASKSRLQIKRVNGLSEYSEVIGRQSEKRKREIGEELWNVVTSQKALLKDQHNNYLPISTDLIDKSGKKIETLGQDIAPKRPPKFGLKSDRRDAPSLTFGEYFNTRYSLHPALDNVETAVDAAVARMWLARNPEGRNPLTSDGMAALGFTSSSGSAGTRKESSSTAPNAPAKNPESPRTRRR